MVGQENVYYVGIGASAGGYDALSEFFSNLSPGTQAAYFLSAYLPRYHKSKLIELIDRHTHMAVIEVNKAIEIRYSNVYLPAENMLMTFHNAAAVAPKKIEADTLHRTIDVFLLSMAECFKQQAIGVILSGSGEDGAAGAIDVFKHGGKVVAQSVASSLFKAMPNATIQRDHPIMIDTPALLAVKVAQMVGSGK